MKCENLTCFLLWPPSPCESSFPRFAGLRAQVRKVLLNTGLLRRQGPGQKGSLMSRDVFSPCCLPEAGKTSLGLGTTQLPGPRAAQGIWEDTEHVMSRQHLLLQPLKTATDQTTGKLLTLEVLNRWDWTRSPRNDCAHTPPQSYSEDHRRWRQDSG